MSHNDTEDAAKTKRCLVFAASSASFVVSSIRRFPSPTLRKYSGCVPLFVFVLGEERYSPLIFFASGFGFTKKRL